MVIGNIIIGVIPILINQKKYFYLIDEVYYLIDFFALETNFQEQ